MLFYGLEHNDDFVGFAYFKGHLKNKTNCNLCNIIKNIKSFFFASTVNLCEDHAPVSFRSSCLVASRASLLVKLAPNLLHIYKLRFRLCQSVRLKPKWTMRGGCNTALRGFQHSLGVISNHANVPVSLAVFSWVSADSSTQHLKLDNTGE